MAVGEDCFPVMHPVPGFQLGTASAGIKKPGREDLVLMAIAPGGRAAGVFTQNAFCAAPVQLAKAHLAGTATRYLVTNTGNANAGTVLTRPGSARKSPNSVTWNPLQYCHFPPG